MVLCYNPRECISLFVTKTSPLRSLTYGPPFRIFALLSNSLIIENDIGLIPAVVLDFIVAQKYQKY